MPHNNDHMKRVTINDVAKAAGVSKTTISRFLSGDVESIAEATYKKIEQTIRDLNYRPNKMARGLKGRRSFLMGMIVADITNPFSTAMLRGAEDTCQANGYSLLVCNSDNNPVKERNYIQMLQSHQIDGLIINTTGQNRVMLLDLQKDNTPIVLIDREVKDMHVDLVTVDNQAATRDALRFLLEQGYTQIGYFTQPIDGVSTRTERVQAFCDFMREESLLHQTSVHELNVADENDVTKAVQLFMTKEAPGPRVIFAGNSVTLLKIGLELQKLHYQVPQDVALIGFDNPDWAQMIGTSSVAQPTYQMGVQAVERLLSRVQGDTSEAQHICLPAELIVRGSTPRVTDMVV